ncbi:kinase-like domain-containing protein [Pilobolus umbonatus]|nr:kinase-like domain-containing protein [Pilobolus umbonatus]
MHHIDKIQSGIARQFNSYFTYIKPLSSEDPIVTDIKDNGNSPIKTYDEENVIENDTLLKDTSDLSIHASAKPLGIPFKSSAIQKEVYKTHNLYNDLEYNPPQSLSSENLSSSASSLTPDDHLPTSIHLTRVKDQSMSPVQYQSPAASFLASFRSGMTTNHSDEVDGYVMNDVIGYGGFSTVRKAEHKNTKDTAAVKVIKLNGATDKEMSRLRREIDIWKSLDHPHILQLKSVVEKTTEANEHTAYLISHFCPKGNLLDSIKENGKLTEEEARKTMLAICEGVYYLHEIKKVSHKDLKLENILIDENGEIMICDFGLAMSQLDNADMNPGDSNMPPEEESVGGSLAYISPEQLLNHRPLTCPKTDIWSLGVILYAVTAGCLPFVDGFDLRLQNKIVKGEYSMIDHMSDSLQSLIRNCLEVDATKRANIIDVMNSAWMNP